MSKKLTAKLIFDSSQLNISLELRKNINFFGHEFEDPLEILSQMKNLEVASFRYYYELPEV